MLPILCDAIICIILSFSCHRWEISLGITRLEWQSKLEANKIICSSPLKYFKIMFSD